MNEHVEMNHFHRNRVIVSRLISDILVQSWKTPQTMYSYLVEWIHVNQREPFKIAPSCARLNCMTHQLRERQRKWLLTFFKTRNTSWSIYHILYIKTFDCQKNRKSVFLEIPENCWMVSEKWSKYIFVILESKSEIDLKITEGSKFQEARFWFSNPTWKRWLSYSLIHLACPVFLSKLSNICSDVDQFEAICSQFHTVTLLNRFFKILAIRSNS